MASAQAKPASSRRLLEAAYTEHVTLDVRLKSIRSRRQVLQRELRDLEREERAVTRRIALLRELTGDHHPIPAPAEARTAAPGRRVIKGAEIRRAAGRLLARSDNPHESLHYTAWFERLVGAGFLIGGRDPLATFLTQLNRSPVVRREGEAGVYRLDYEAVALLEEELLRLHDELARLHSGQQTIEAIASARERRSELTAAIERVERRLEEAVSTLHVR